MGLETDGVFESEGEKREMVTVQSAGGSTVLGVENSVS